MVLVAILGAALILTAALGGFGQPKHRDTGYYAPVVRLFSEANITGNQTANQTANQTSNQTAYDPQYTEINMNLSAVDQSLGLDVTAEQGIPSVMLTHFEVTLRAPGNSSYLITDSALHGGSDVYRQGTFSYETNLSLNGTNSGYATMQFHITSGKLQHTEVFTYIFQFMTPQNYISYEHAKLAPAGSYTTQDLAYVGVGVLILGISLFRVWLPFMRKKIRKDNKKEGMILLARN